MQCEEKQIIIASPRGFCAGVVRAIATVENMLADYGSPIYVLHEIVHNKHVIADLQARGAVFVEKLEQIPESGICVFSAHGVSREVEKKAKASGLRTVDGTCPLVSSIHRIVERYSQMGCEVVIIGHHNHPEVVGTAGRTNNQVHVIATEEEARVLQLKEGAHCVFVTQTTLSQDDVGRIVAVLQERYPAIESPKSTICYATQNRQDAVCRLAKDADIIFVVGSKNSSNSNRLREVALREGTEAYLIDDCNDIDPDWLCGKARVGITAGASAPERLVEEVIAWLKARYQTTLLRMEGGERKLHFRPAELR